MSDARGRTLAYLDRLDGRVHVEDEADRDAVTGVVQPAGAPALPEQGAPDRAEQRSAVAVPARALPDLQPYAVTVEHLAIDLARNAAGAGAQAKADELRAQAPVRTLLARVLRVHTDERAWRVGARGERIAAEELAKLGKGWSVVHDVTVGTRGANIDHVVVGPGGVFTVNAQVPRGEVGVGGGRHRAGRRAPSSVRAQRPARSRPSVPAAVRRLRQSCPGHRDRRGSGAELDGEGPAG